MFVLFIPPSVNNLGESRIVVRALEGVDIGEGFRGGSFRSSRRQWIGSPLVRYFRRFGLLRRFGAIVEEALSARSDALVHSEEVEVIVLRKQLA